MKVKKIIAISVAVIMALSLILSGCGTSNTGTGGTTDSSGTAGTTAAKSTDAEKPVELVWYSTVNKKMSDEDVVFEKLNEYLKEKLNVTVKQYLMTGADYKEKMPVIISSGQAYDICFTSSGTNPYLVNVAKGAFEPLNDLLEQYAPETKKKIPDILWNGVAVNGKIYGIPSYKEIGHQFGLFINKTLADELGVDISGVKTWNDFVEVIKEVKQKKPDVICFNVGTNIDYLLPSDSVVGNMVLPGVIDIPFIRAYNRNDDKVFNQYETPEFRALCEQMHELYKGGYFPKDPVNYKGQVPHEDFSAKKLFASNLIYAPNYEQTYSQQRGVEVVWVPLHDPIVSTSDTMGGLQAISVNSKHKKEAMQFLNLVNTDITVGTMLRHGIEGKHYLIVDGMVDKTAVSGIDPTNHPYDISFGWQFGTVFNQIWNKPYPPNIEEIFQNYNASAKPAPSLGFTFDNTNVQNEIAALLNVIKEFRDPLLTGMVDPNVYLPQFIEKLKANGADKLIEEAQRQFDEFKASLGK